MGGVENAGASAGTGRELLGARLVAVLCVIAAAPPNSPTGKRARTSADREPLLQNAVPANALVIREPGGGYTVLCESAESAVVSAMELVEGVQANDQEGNDQPPFSAGVELGEVLVGHDNVEGAALVLARHFARLAAAGQVLISENVHREVRNELTYGYESIGAHEPGPLGVPEHAYVVHSSAAGLGMAASTRTTPDRELSRAATRSAIVVLPFRELTRATGDNWFAEGITDDIIVQLSRFQNLFVIARNSAFSIAERADPHQTARELGVRYLARGSIRRAGKMIRVSAELADLGNGQVVWAENYDRSLDDIFEIQDDIVRRVVVACAVQIEASDRRRSVQSETGNIDAYSMVLRAQHHNYRYRPADSALAGQLYTQAIAADQGFARAHAGLSRTLNIDWRYGWTKEPETALENALNCARTAVELDPGDARGFAELGFAHLYRKEFDESISIYERALTLNPNDADLMSDMADALSHTGNPEKGIELLQQAMLLNPFYPDQYLWHLGGCYYVTRQYEAAVETLNRMNNPAEGRRLLAASYGQLGRTEEARSHADKLLQHHPGFSLEHWAAVLPDQYEETREHYIEGLRKAGLT
ncbi:MAG: tetratricopeptide repeat protein [Pseudomonadota bacterium]